ncbi:hypothetical protein CP967_16635 [Streptomyces nitrosporeus]|uniref:Uncharacterized protein n=1 Tax=Streptomyces nitrosporeus TaxID=28894 RepID=A0A5J6FA67_9ACTN|nr:hypothetical protein CP967_16635 [Streptomyces nitrosporeus]
MRAVGVPDAYRPHGPVSLSETACPARARTAGAAGREKRGGAGRAEAVRRPARACGPRTGRGAGGCEKPWHRPRMPCWAGFSESSRTPGGPCPDVPGHAEARSLATGDAPATGLPEP